MLAYTVIQAEMMKCLKIKTQHKIKKLKSLEEKNRNLLILYQNNMWIEKVNYMF